MKTRRSKVPPNKRLQLTAAVGGVRGGQPSGGRPPVGATVVRARPQLSRDPLD